jgi:beta-lactamase regulating signal transducer with metallopeptidase domain
VTTSVTKTVLATTGGVAAAVSVGPLLRRAARRGQAQFTAHLIWLTGFGATILSDATKTSRSAGDD